MSADSVHFVVDAVALAVQMAFDAQEREICWE